MFNTFLYNQSVFNKINEFGEAYKEQDDFVYNGYGLSNADICITGSSFDNSHEVQQETYIRPLTDLGGQLSYFYRGKTVILNGILKGENREDLNNRIDEFKKYIGKPNKNLEIKVNGTIRTAVASCVNMNSLFDRKHYNITFIPFTVQFLILSDFFHDKQKQSHSITGVTASYTEEIINMGTAKSDPKTLLVFNSASGVNSIVYNIGNKSITISEPISAGDVVIIDSETKTVTIGGIEYGEYTGEFPEIDIGTNSYTLTVNGTKNFNTTILFPKNYL